jgi:hypothetical protein
MLVINQSKVWRGWLPVTSVSSTLFAAVRTANG